MPRMHPEQTQTCRRAPLQVNNDLQGRVNSATPRPATAIKPQSMRVPDLHKPKSSAGLREHIAKARAELQKSNKKVVVPMRSVPNSLHTQNHGQKPHPEDYLDDDPFSAIKDPFNQAQHKIKIDPRVESAIKQARTDGRLNISSLQLSRIPKAVCEMYKPDPSHVIDFSQDSGPSWYDFTDLTYFNAADNELNSFDEELLAILGALETLDLHNNILHILPECMIRLDRLTTVNVSGNGLSMRDLERLCELPSITELNMSRNKLSGLLPIKIGQLHNLRTLDLSDNELDAIDYALTGCPKLQVLNLSGNFLKRLTVSQLSQQSGLAELDASRNAIESAFLDGNSSFPRLGLLNLSHNNLTELSAGPYELELPSLTTLLLIQNQIEDPSPLLTRAPNLIDLNVEGNRLSHLPELLFTLNHLKHLDISDNRLTEISHHVGFMHQLTQLGWEGNPVRMRGCFGLSTAEMLAYLRGRAPADHAGRHAYEGGTHALEWTT